MWIYSTVRCVCVCVFVSIPSSAQQHKRNKRQRNKKIEHLNRLQSRIAFIVRALENFVLEQKYISIKKINIHDKKKAKLKGEKQQYFIYLVKLILRNSANLYQYSVAALVRFDYLDDFTLSELKNK